MKDEAPSKFILPADLGGEEDIWGPRDFIIEKSQGLSQDEAKLCVDVAETDEELIVVATMAGTDTSDLELHLHGDLLTIRGERKSPSPQNADRHMEENYWGRFSRAIVLPANIRAEEVRAEYKNGILSIYLPKTSKDRNIPVLVVEE